MPAGLHEPRLQGARRFARRQRRRSEARFPPRAGTRTSSRLGSQRRKRITERNSPAFLVPPALVFDHLVFESPFTDDHAMGETDQLRVREHYAWALVPVVEQDLYTPFGQHPI